MIPSDVSRKLTTIEHALIADMPALAARFELFNRLAASDGPVTEEPVADPAPATGRNSGPASGRTSPKPAHLVILLVLGAVVALCLTLSLRLGPSPRQCATATAASGRVTGIPVHAPACTAYATNK